MGKNNARSLKIPSASWIRNVIKEEVKAQLEERETEKRGPRRELMDGPMMDGPTHDADGWNEWWDGPRPSERSERAERPEPRRRERARDEARSETNERAMWSLWDGGDLLSDPIMEEGPRRNARNQDWESTVEKEIEASISPVKKSRAKRPRTTAKKR